MFTLNQFLVQRGIYKLSAYGTLPLDLLRAKENRRNPDAQMNLDLHLDNANLDILPTLTKYVQWATGPMKKPQCERDLGGLYLRWCDSSR